jgi:2-polyprenyl-3-methyl-5-hydroxy-6-metoxy-1,4-benzoquinol methylase
VQKSLKIDATLSRIRGRLPFARRRDPAAASPVSGDLEGQPEALPGGPPSARAGDTIEVLSSLDALDRKLEEVDAAWAISDDAMREVFQGFMMGAPTGLPSDPFSGAYADAQLAFYGKVAARPHYDVENELSGFPTDPNRPFPYYTQSSATVAAHLIALGFIIKTMALPAESTILELGAGWGNTTIALAQMGYDVTAIDIEPNFVDLIRTRAERMSLAVDVRQMVFLEVDHLDRRFDAVLFYESFHHCSDHRELVRKLAEMINPEGRVFFAAEPIDESFVMPWGVRTDGESLWAIRRNGWLELGFQESYFLRMLSREGWIVDKHVTDATHLGVIFEARRANGSYEIGSFVMPPDERESWTEPDAPGGLGPYAREHTELSLEVGGGYSTIVIDAFSYCPKELAYRVRHGVSEVAGSAPAGGTFTIELPYDRRAESLVIESTTWRPIDLLHSPDVRTLGIGIRSVSLV